MTVPASLKLAGLETKHLLKQAVKDLIPHDILHRPKQGFGVPIQDWINEQLRSRIRETLTEPRTRQRGFVNSRYVDVLLGEHEQGRRDHSTGLWALLMLELWHRQFVDSNGHRP
jgi:asparagine synthase (glutamine-hydrolysing)